MESLVVLRENLLRGPALLLAHDTHVGGREVVKSGVRRTLDMVGVTGMVAVDARKRGGDVVRQGDAPKKARV